ncbi:MAG: hypothetical protein ACOY16_00815 [Chloroflexota bacterium]
MRSTQRMITAIFLLLALTLSACSAATPQPSAQPPQTTHPEPPPAAPPTPESAAEAARQTLAQQLGITVDQIEIFTSEPREWPNSCLDLPQEGETCAQVITSGYAGILLVGETQYEFRTDSSGANVRFLPGPALAAQQVLAAQLSLLPEDVRIISSEKVDWPDACLGISTSGQMCAQVITPGFRIRLEANGKSYEYHTDLTGSDVRLALAPDITEGQVLLRWEGQVNGQCQRLTVSEAAVVYGPCDGVPVTTLFSAPERQTDLDYYVGQYAAFDTQTTAGAITLAGQGSVSATPSEQRMIAEWARQLWQEIQPAPPSGYTVVAFVWRREGGIAGFCDNLLVSLDGTALITSCKSPQMQSSNRVRLTSAQMQQIFAWVDTLAPFESSTGDMNTADGMMIRLSFNGRGAQTAGENEQMAISQLASEIITSAERAIEPIELDAIQHALSRYFNALAAGDYATAAALYGGSYDILISNNPDISPSDKAALFQRACTQNGFVCDVTVKNWVNAVRISQDEFRLTVELQNPDGTLFVLGPCCGASPDEFPPLTQFEFVVVNHHDGWLVMDLPLYVP